MRVSLEGETIHSGGLTIFIISSPRKPHYLGISLDSLFSEFDNVRPHVFCEPGTPNFYGQTRCVRHDNLIRLGCPQNWFHAILHPVDTEWLLICEDDVFWTPGSGEIINNYMKNPSDVLAVSPYCSLPNGVVNSPVGWNRPRFNEITGLCGALAILFSQKGLDKMRSSQDEFVRLSEGKHLDYPIGNILKDQLLCHMPSLVHHLGVVSTFKPSRIPDDNVTKARTVFDSSVHNAQH